ncbi:MAG TPA: CmcI family methyltransferase [Bryobacteraceae bacterium]|jgi:cephalosporin hydroxylase|nr:CmcI family methyltransferase [Bryobacteraceae bacterium]
MKIVIDTDSATLQQTAGGVETSLGLYTKEAFEVLSRQWTGVGFALKYYHNFSWFGLPILQLPEDLVRLQEVVYALRPTVIIETGVFRGGSLLHHASLFEALGKGRVIGIDLEIAAADRESIRQHFLGPRITLIEGDSTGPETLARVSRLLRPEDSVLVLLDSAHTKDHVARELECYAPFVTAGSYIVAADGGVMRDAALTPRGDPSWTWDNPTEAAREFAARHPEFSEEQPPWLFHDGELTENVSYWRNGWLKRV